MLAAANASSKGSDRAFDPVQDRDLLEGQVRLIAKPSHGVDDRGGLGRLVESCWAPGGGPSSRVAVNARGSPPRCCGERVRQAEHLRRRAVVLGERHDLRARVPRGEPRQVGRRGAGERVDRLVVVADHADVVAVAYPRVEERRLQRVHVLVLVDRERVEPRAEHLGGVGVLLEQVDREREHVLEVDPAHRRASCARSPRTRGASGRPGSAARARRAQPAYAAGSIRRFFAHSISFAQLATRRELVRASAATGRTWRSRPPCGRAPAGGPRRCARSTATAARRARRSGTCARRRPGRRAGRAARAARPPPSSVNVTARIDRPGNVPVATWCAIRWVIVVVLPGPRARDDRDGTADRLGRPPLRVVQAREGVGGTGHAGDATTALRRSRPAARGPRAARPPARRRPRRPARPAPAAGRRPRPRRRSRGSTTTNREERDRPRQPTRGEHPPDARGPPRCPA